MAPRITAVRNRGRVGGNDEVDLKFPNSPAIEFRNIKAETVPLVCLVVLQPNQMIIGDRKIPPPVPVIPESIPMPAPRSIAKAGTIFLGVRSTRCA